MKLRSRKIPLSNPSSSINTSSSRSLTKRKARKSLGKFQKQKVKLVEMETDGSQASGQSSSNSFTEPTNVPQNVNPIRNQRSQSTEAFLGFSNVPEQQDLRGPPNPNPQTVDPFAGLNMNNQGLPLPINPTNQNSYGPPHSANIPRNPWAYNNSDNLTRHSMPPSTRTDDQSDTNKLLKLLIEKIDKGFTDLSSKSNQNTFQTYASPYNAWRQAAAEQAAAANTFPNPRQIPPQASNFTFPTAIPSQSHTHTAPSFNPYIRQVNSANQSNSQPQSGAQNPDVTVMQSTIQGLSNQITALNARLNSMTLGTSNPNPHTQDNQSHEKSFYAPPYKWTLKYNGDNSKLSVEDFVMQLETLMKINNFSWRQVSPCVNSFLEGEARQWYFDRQSVYSDPNWESLKKALVSAFGKTVTDTQILMSMSSRRQGEKEIFRRFYQDLQSYRTRLQRDYSDDDMLSLIKLNVKPSIRQTLFTYNTTSLEDYLSKCRETDEFLYPHLYQTREQNLSQVKFQSSNKRVGEIEQQAQFETTDALNLEYINYAQKAVCWNCDQPGHIWIDCEETLNIFCYRCGLKNCTTRTCNNCIKTRQNFRPGFVPKEPPPP